MDSRKNRSSKARTQQPKPYDRSENPSIFTRVRRFFTPAAWAAEVSDSDSLVVRGPEPFTFPEPDISALTTPKTLKLSSSTFSASPNATLAEFFQRRGDNPLSEIEMEGVQSLLKRLTAKNTPVKGVSTPDTTVLRFPSELGHTPVVATPLFTPSYATSPAPTHSAKRVYQFSGLPSPYRTRIRSPLAARLPIISLPIKRSDKPLSSTASALLSLLELPLPETPAGFSNPYAKRRLNDLEQSTPKKATILDIENTIEKAPSGDFSFSVIVPTPKAEAKEQSTEAVKPFLFEKTEPVKPSLAGATEVVSTTQKPVFSSGSSEAKEPATSALFGKSCENGSDPVKSAFAPAMNGPATAGAPDVSEKEEAALTPCLAEEFVFPLIVPAANVEVDDLLVAQYKDIFTF
ncbi:hypothetical protein BABINDRAFT_163439 [Babjeviella inositovora NRRL Y-12698]|uniref:Uncharacterized protein n=1 Tax=Babjeviella inositovora NRRL Y-12698 TaxID=984486 RepID=A0A1E3QJ54_9ASCO|nr:uncharacterized protein BABINDRAFT_163439 [Babjeviella inositovora NRRL Y-12698]ODQ77736.1 hypothetical protein BABINDRAFT_163439 [Babjeviella inositovora NRRL Y-12698]